jgi:choline-sulfatase
MFQYPRLFSTAVVCLAVLSGVSCGSRREESVHRPDIILISLDTLRPDHLEIYDYSRETAPALAMLATQSVVFDNAFSQAPKTGPSHMSLFTGLYPAAHGVRNLDEADNRALSRDIPLMAETLRAAGYRTAAFTGGGHMGETLGFNRGFETFMTGGMQFRRAADWVRGIPDEDRPFFLLVHTYSIHDPYLPEKRFQVFGSAEYSGEIIGDEEEMEQLVGDAWEDQHKAFWDRVDPESEDDLRQLRDLYDAGILATDFQLNQLLGILREVGVLSDALIIVLSDHGEEFKEHGGYLHESLYQENLRIPFLMRFPGELGASLAGVRVQSTVRLVDVLPTLLDYLGLEGAERLQGSSFLPLLEKPRRAIPREILSEYPRHGHRALQLGEWKLIVNPDGLEELYNLAADPTESENLIATHAAEAQRLRRRLAQLVSESEGIQQLVTIGEAQDLDPEVKKQLEALGYVE